jgi:pimeloyl-ACP methyl ester carboxylesterase
MHITAGGSDICCERRGDGPVVLMIQGVGVIGNGWRPQVDVLSSRFTTITFDNRGVGGTVRGADPLTIERMAADAIALIDALRIDRFHVIGHSMGGVVAQEVALTATPRIKSLSLLCTFANGRDATRLSLPGMLKAIRSRVGTRAMRRRGMLRLIMPDDYLRASDTGTLAADLEALFGHDLGDQPPVAMAQLRATSRYNLAHRLSALASIPSLVVSGRHDPIAPPRTGRALASALGTARYVELEEASHALPIQCAAEVNALLIDHLVNAERAALV